MATEISAPFVSSIGFSIAETNGGESITLSDSASISNTFYYEANGSGVRTISNAAAITGILSSGDSQQIDLNSVAQKTIGSTQNIAFTGIKHFSVYNLSQTKGYDFTIQATGTNACTNLFNGGSGNLLVKPFSSFSYNDPYTGFTVNSSNRYVYLNDLGSGVFYKLIILGLD
jgi:hypothetical protein